MESSLSYQFIDLDMAEKIIKEHGTDKIFFGSDYPFGIYKGICSGSKGRKFSIG